MKISYNIKQECLWIVRGYDTRRRNYEQAKADIMQRMIAGAGDGTPRGTNVSNPTEQRTMEIDKMESWPEVKKMRAVEYAERQIGQDVINEEVRDRLRKAIVQNCKSGKKYPFEEADLTEFSRMDFYRRKTKFLIDVASYLEMV